MSEPADPSGRRRHQTEAPIRLGPKWGSPGSTTESCHRSEPHQLEFSSKDSSEVARYTCIDRVSRWHGRCYSGGARHHTSTKVRESDGGYGYDHITFFLCLVGTKCKGIKSDCSAKIIAADLQGTQASPFLRVLWYWTKSLAGVYVHKLALTLREQRPQTGVAPSHLWSRSEWVLQGRERSGSLSSYD